MVGNKFRERVILWGIIINALLLIYFTVCVWGETNVVSKVFIFLFAAWVIWLGAFSAEFLPLLVPKIKGRVWTRVAAIAWVVAGFTGLFMSLEYKSVYISPHDEYFHASKACEWKSEEYKYYRMTQLDARSNGFKPCCCVRD